jgi:hypothetical protein
VGPSSGIKFHTPSGFDLPLDASFLCLLPDLFPLFHIFASLFWTKSCTCPRLRRRAGSIGPYTSALYGPRFSVYKGENTDSIELKNHADKSDQNSIEKFSTLAQWQRYLFISNNAFSLHFSGYIPYNLNNEAWR